MNVCRTTGFFSVLLLAACATEPVRPVPVVDRTKPQGSVTSKPPTVATATSPAAGGIEGKSWVVKPGDTLYSIALENGLDYKEIATWNQLVDVNLIKIDQVLRLTDPGEEPAQTSTGVVLKPLKQDAEVTPPMKATTATAGVAAGVATISYPRSLKLSYSTDAPTVARQAEGPQQSAPKVTDTTKVVENSKSTDLKTAEAKPQESKPAVDRAAASGEEDLNWVWPTSGKVITPFSESAKGVDIGGKVGQPVLAASPGRVVYAGSGLRGYGKLVIIKHNKTYLSAYAHNNQLLVKEGDNVKKGDKIAEMGNSDAEQVKLHFEIRRFGKPVDPSKYLTTG
ncbi:peptidoglycan DD-metalloendopeptidase family protein [Chitinimonas sp. BJB300]|uniref:peptidoglycan DD-metalloendopeptidase family protein n=1 Tax=Chitinimonas sp. BJB300 TaxID=1559339 RepID=UPI000C0D3C2B|nr:peptidoglycan DD-metalloendopeptidase family protein [Chitinimonas sp. BJB300]PHV11378.1 peptidase M23 [Chitinimonas sp. BJB300]TSJ88903.1 peptidoglycan DD-metalloendopeptidase family protein [Chitinimonas sp. BJB300]